MKQFIQSRDFMETKRIAFIVDNLLRDLVGLVLVAHELAQQEVDCYLVPSDAKQDELMSLRPDIVVVFNLRKSLNQFFRNLLDTGMSVVLLDVEGGVWPSIADYAELLTSDRAILDQITRVCLWGKRMKPFLRENGYFSESQLCITGCPRFDVYNAKWRDLIQTNGKDDRPQILVNTNTSELNQRGTTREENKAFYINRYGWPKERVDAHFQTQETAYRLTVEMIRQLVRDFPECRIVVRPHPFEDLGIYARDLRGLDLRLTQEGPVAAELFKAAAVVQRSCTTGIEAGMASVPTLSPQWIPAAMPMPSAEAVSVPCGTYGDLRQTLSRIVSGSFQMPGHITATLGNVLEEWFCGIDGMAHARVAAVLRNSFPKTRQVAEEKCSRLLYGLNKPGGLEGLGRALRFYGNLPPQWCFRKLRTAESSGFWNGLPLASIMQDIGRMVGILNGQKAGLSKPLVQVAPVSANGRYSHGYRGTAISLHRA